jgi:hypothetical protein
MTIVVLAILVLADWTKTADVLAPLAARYEVSGRALSVVEQTLPKLRRLSQTWVRWISRKSAYAKTVELW